MGIAYAKLQKKLLILCYKDTYNMMMLKNGRVKQFQQRLFRRKIAHEQPVDTFGVRLINQQYLNSAGRVVSRFKDNLLGEEFAFSFLKRHSKILSERMFQNIKRARAGVARTTITGYFEHLFLELEGIPASNVINYDGTNLCNDPGRKKIIAKRECKYLNRIIVNRQPPLCLLLLVVANFPLVMWSTKRRICTTLGLLEGHLVPGTIGVGRDGSTVTVSEIGFTLSRRGDANI
ncbi:hypothetical protein JTB14_013297 [Gonioctena quinquepunctata]|nr:hypothetical protein JTB14_013297 [Gonioctena quinquepunctata]